MATTLTRNEIRTRAAKFIADWRDVSHERAEKDTFWNEFLAIFGVERRRVATFEKHAKRISTGRAGFIDVFWPGYLIAEHKSRGANLTAAINNQAIDYLGSIPAEQHPRLVIASDFARFRVVDLDASAKDQANEVEFSIDDLSRELDRFMFLAGYERRFFRDQDAVNVDAAELLGDVYTELDDAGYNGHDLRILIVRLLFVLFCDDTGVWEKGQFERYLKDRTAADGHDLGMHISRLFDVLNTPDNKRSKSLDEDLSAFPYVNGGLFSERIATPDCTRSTRDVLLAASAFNWSVISPAIFGSIFQSVMDEEKRHQLGAHYTTEKNIRRVIEPLFLEDIRKDMEECGKSKQKLRNLHDRISKMTFFDPAMGCGNFLVVTYIELRRIESEILKRINSSQYQLTIELDTWKKVNVGQFFGIEIEEFPARIAETAMYLADHLENESLGKMFGVNIVDLPLKGTARVHIGNALTVDWNTILPAKNCSFLLGNPPFAGQKTRNASQTRDLRAVWGTQYSRWLDYVTGWYKKASDYLQGSTNTRVAFVSTNSVTQGEQAGRMWKPLLDSRIKIDFAHRTFNWSSEARGKANVHVVIVGFSIGGRAATKTIFDYEDINGDPAARVVSEINPYLVTGPSVLVHARREPLSSCLPSVNYGNKPADGGFLVVEDCDKPTSDTVAMEYIRRYVGAQELLHNEKRWCLWLEGVTPKDISASKFIRERVESVRKYRQASSAADTRKYADHPTRFFRIPQPTTKYIAIPRHVSENRRWFTVGHFSPDVIASDALFTAVDPDGFLFGVFSSAMFISWMRTVGGTLESRLRFAGLIVYNPFPMPDPSTKARERVIDAASQVLKIRTQFKGTSLADLYDPNQTPSSLVDAHKVLDRAIDRIYRPRGSFSNDSDRLSTLFGLYAEMTRNESPEDIADDEDS